MTPATDCHSSRDRIAPSIRTYGRHEGSVGVDFLPRWQISGCATARSRGRYKSGMPDLSGHRIDWPDNAWDELGTGLVTGVVTGLVAVGLFLAQRRSDRNHARDQQTLDGIEKVRRVTFTLIDKASANAHMYPRDQLGDWETELSIQRPRIDSRHAQELISDAQRIPALFKIRSDEAWAVNQAKPTMTDDGFEDLSDRKAVSKALVEYLERFNLELSKWTPRHQRIAKRLVSSPVLTEPYSGRSTELD